MHLLPAIPAIEEHIQPIQRHQGSPGPSTGAPRPGPTRRARAGVDSWSIEVQLSGLIARATTARTTQRVTQP